ncbi:MAG: class I SAM-dependent methyltransferase [Bacillota bacterium]
MQERVERYYDANAAYEWNRLDRHRMEFALTMRALGRHLEDSSRILDVGGGPGRYAITLAQQGHRVTLLDLSAANLAFARQKAAELGVELESVVHGNALDLSRFEPASFDAVLLMGPLYHLLEPEERERSVREALRVLKPGGLLAATIITRYAGLRDIAAHEPEELLEAMDRLEELFRTGVVRLPEGSGFTDSYRMHPTELTPFMESFGLTTLEVLGQEGLLFLIEEKVNQLTGPLWDAWVDVNERVAGDPTIWGQCAHLLYLGEGPR